MVRFHVTLTSQFWDTFWEANPWPPDAVVTAEALLLLDDTGIITVRDARHALAVERAFREHPNVVRVQRLRYVD